jgi:hypothetical protein
MGEILTKSRAVHRNLRREYLPEESKPSTVCRWFNLPCRQRGKILTE